LPTKLAPRKGTKSRRAAPRRTYHHGDLRAALIRAALALIADHGVKGFALSDAARLAGVSVAAPYRHFKDKEALLAEIAAEGFTMFRDALALASQNSQGDKLEALEEMGVAYVAFALQHSSHFKVMWEGGISKEKYAVVRQPADQAFVLLQQGVLDLLPKAKPDRQQALVSAAWSLVHGYATLTLEHEMDVVAGGQSDTKLLRQSIRLLLDQFAAK
jgi:AcrR family transcriptional regulator